MRVALLLLITAVHGCISIVTKIAEKRVIQTNRPIIGVFAQSTTKFPLHTYGKSYIAASYVKYLESSGARVVPIMNDLTEEEIIKLIYSINGVFFPGGRDNLKSSGFAKTTRIIFNLAKKLNDNGDYFPLWGTCLSFQYLAYLVNNNLHSTISRTDSSNLSLPLNLSQGYHNSRMFRDIPEDLANSLVPITMHSHYFSITEKTFSKSQKLKDFFKVLSRNKDRKGVEFVSTFEAKIYPFYGTQWHPEKNSFEWVPDESIPHEAISVKAAQYMSNFFVNEARYSKHKFRTIEEEQSAIIYNYCPIYTGNISTFQQCYIFNKKSSH